MVIAATYLPALSAQAQVIPASRDFSSGWRHAGIEGDIPTPNRIISVRNYGVLGLGLTNEQTGIQNAINALGGTGGVVYFPAGSYIINSSLTIKSNVVLRGERSFNTQIVITNVPAGEVHGINIIQNSQTGKWIDMASILSRTPRLESGSISNPATTFIRQFSHSPMSPPSPPVAGLRSTKAPTRPGKCPVGQT
jgi:hypothetical protein